MSCRYSYILPKCVRCLMFAALMLSATCRVSAQDMAVRRITLHEAIALARKQSVDAASALVQLKSAYWSYRTFRANLMPEVNFAATLPSYSKNYSIYQQSDGSHTYVRNDYMNINGSLSIDQSIWFTGGTLSLSTSLDFLSQLGAGRDGRQFMAVPIVLTLNQPIFGVNNVKWNRRIEPLRYTEAQANFLSATEKVTMSVIQYFFNLLLAQENANDAWDA